MKRVLARSRRLEEFMMLVLYKKQPYLWPCHYLLLQAP
jgi:hypothetical protein